MNKKLYSTNELRKVLGVGKNLVYKLLARDDFPKIIINGRYFVPSEKLDKWIDHQMKLTSKV